MVSGSGMGKLTLLQKLTKTEFMNFYNTQSCRRTLSAGGWWWTENKAPMMMSPGMCATTRRSLDWAESAWSGPTHMARTSSNQSIILVQSGNKRRSRSQVCCVEPSQGTTRPRNTCPLHGRTSWNRGALEYGLWKYSSLPTCLSCLRISRCHHHCDSWDRCSSATWEIQKTIGAKSHWLT